MSKTKKDTHIGDMDVFASRKGMELEVPITIAPQLLGRFFTPERIIYNDPVTICYFADGTKRTSTCRGTDQYNKEMGVAVCIVKKIFKRYSNFLRLLDNGYEQEQPLLPKETIKKLKPTTTTLEATEKTKINNPSLIAK
jgi:hypothetical protein